MTNDPSFTRWCTDAFHGPSGFLSLLPYVLGSVWSFSPSIEVSALAVSASAAAWSAEVLESAEEMVDVEPEVVSYPEYVVAGASLIEDGA